MLLNSIINNFKGKWKHVDHKTEIVEVFDGPPPRMNFIKKFYLALE